ncbi:MAG TPA: hypothetical protein VF543_22140 [Pyrinomonadaceae bacterium]|jgi:hypothetical protein
MDNDLERCNLCGEIIAANEGRTAFKFNYVESDDPLWPFRDSVMHHRCFVAWKLKERYIKKFNENIGSINNAGKVYYMNQEGHVEERKADSE